jgi:hypothetical protein
VAEALQQLEGGGMTALVMDLRDNAGVCGGCGLSGQESGTDAVRAYGGPQVRYHCCQGEGGPGGQGEGGASATMA